MIERRPALLLCLPLLALSAGCTGLETPQVFSIEREPPGFVLPHRPVILFFVDGLRKDVLEEVAGRGELPLLRRHLLDRAASVRNAVTSVPGVTFANAASLATGCWPGTHSVWANVWFDRYQLFTRNYGADRDAANADLKRPTLYEDLSGSLTAVVAMAVRRGVKLPLAVSVRSGALAAGVAWTIDMQERSDALLAEQVYELGETARRLGEWPAFVAIYQPAVDDTGHSYGCDGPEYRRSVASLDASIGSLLEAFAQADLLEELTLVLVSDHGQTPAPQSFSLPRYLRSTLETAVHPVLEDDGARPYLARWEEYSRQRLIVTTSGERQASLHLRAGDRWEERPNLEEILAFPRSPETSAGERTLPELLLDAPPIDLVAVRAGEHEVRIHNRRGSAALVRTNGAGEPRFAYRPLAGDPLCYGEDERLAAWVDGSEHTSREWLAASAEHRYPDLVPQLVSAFDSPRSGDVLVFATPGWDFSEDYAGGHGGLEREEMLVPLYFAGPDIRPGVEIPAARLVDVVPTILELSGTEVSAERRFDGVSLARELR